MNTFWIQFKLFSLKQFLKFRIKWSTSSVAMVFTRKRIPYLLGAVLFFCLKIFTRRENNAGRCRRQRPALFSLQIIHFFTLYLNVASISYTRAYLQLFQSPFSLHYTISNLIIAYWFSLFLTFDLFFFTFSIIHEAYWHRFFLFYHFASIRICWKILQIW